MVEKKIKTIVWDWNGTLLDDVDLCIKCMNQLLEERSIQEMNKSHYREIFTFPVKAYYKMAGFDFSIEDFEKPAMEFIQLYYENLSSAILFKQVIQVLDRIKEKGMKQFILSAMEHDSLIHSMKEKKIFHYFEGISGIDNHYAHSKLEMGRNLLDKYGLNKNEILLIGDTLHDLDVGKNLGLKVLLVANGHQSKERLLEKTDDVVDDLNEIFGYLG